MTFSKIKPMSTAQQVIEQIMEAIQSGDLSVGDRLPSERKLAELLGVSRPTVRQGITTLATLGVLEIQLGVGTFVRSRLIDETLALKAVRLLPTNERFFQALEARILMMPGVAAMAAQRAEESDLENMRTALNAVSERAAQNETFGSIGKTYHMIIVRSVRNSVIEHACRIALGTWFSSDPDWSEIRNSILKKPGRLVKYYEAYVRIYDAIASREPDRAEAEMLTLLRDVQEDYLRLAAGD